ncbi:MAG: glycine--tRNA ligase subunit beta [Candidatus Portnoybacteria bacterium]|nr:glycine--tRNA ligase subunit beta [Candidatus Portnoybacteria bacterium]
MSKELLFEIGTEEIPAGYIGPALSQIKEMAQKYLTDAGFTFSKIQTLGTPRRMVLVVENLEMSGKSQGAELLLRSSAPQAIVELKKILPKIISGISFSKSMRWGDGSLRFARPIRWLTAVYSEEVIDFEIDGLSAQGGSASGGKSGDFSYGHRFLSPARIATPVQSPDLSERKTLPADGDQEGEQGVAGGPDQFVVKNFEQYQRELKNRFVILDQKERKNLIKGEIEAAAVKVDGKVLPDEKLLETVTWLVEYPAVLLGSFKKEFLLLPKEVLIIAMRQHQKYFSLVNDRGNLIPYFVTISNTKVDEPEIIIKGNEKVLAARLNDAQFLFEADKKVALAKRVDSLKKVTFQEKLGSMHEKAQRLVRLSEFIAPVVDSKARSNAARAALLAKTDLITEMVGEFPELQGIMGSYYAKLSGEKETVALAIAEQYLPRFSGDSLPITKEGAIVSIADKIDSLVGYFSLGLIPTATEDPYALRRQALGVLQIIWQTEFSVSLKDLIDKAAALYKKSDKEKKKIDKELMEFLGGRLENFLESKKISKPVISAVLSSNGWFDDLSSFRKRVEALEKARAKSEFELLKSAMKRVNNILSKKVSKKTVSPKFLQEPAEKDLYKMIMETQKVFEKKIKQRDFEEALNALMVMAPFIHKFFDKVLVMAKNKKVKENRIILLGAIRLMANEIADFSKLV